MTGKQHKVTRKPATKFGHLQKKIGQQKSGQNFTPLRPKSGKSDKGKR